MVTVGSGCSGISSALIGANLISAVVHSYPKTEAAFGQPVRCALGYTWTDGTTYLTPKSVICYFSSGPKWYLPSCTGMPDVLSIQNSKLETSRLARFGMVFLTSFHLYAYIFSNY